MKQLWITVAGVALILLAAQTWFVWQSRDDHLETTIASARIDACAKIGAAAADFRTWARQGRREVRDGGAAGLRQNTREMLQDKPIELIRAVEVGRYTLPSDPFGPYLAELADATVKMQPALAQGEVDRADNLLIDFDTAAKGVQDSCAEVVRRTPFVAQ